MIDMPCLTCWKEFPLIFGCANLATTRWTLHRWPQASQHSSCLLGSLKKHKWWAYTLYLMGVAHLELQIFLISFREDSNPLHCAELIHILHILTIHFKFALWLDRIWTAGKSECEKITRQLQINPHESWDFTSWQAPSSVEGQRTRMMGTWVTVFDQAYFWSDCSKNREVSLLPGWQSWTSLQLQKRQGITQGTSA